MMLILLIVIISYTPDSFTCHNPASHSIPALSTFESKTARDHCIKLMSFVLQVVILLCGEVLVDNYTLADLAYIFQLPNVSILSFIQLILIICCMFKERDPRCDSSNAIDHD